MAEVNQVSRTTFEDELTQDLIIVPTYKFSNMQENALETYLVALRNVLLYRNGSSPHVVHAINLFILRHAPLSVTYEIALNSAQAEVLPTNLRQAVDTLDDLSPGLGRRLAFGQRSVLHSEDKLEQSTMQGDYIESVALKDQVNCEKEDVSVGATSKEDESCVDGASRRQNGSNLASNTRIVSKNSRREKKYFTLDV